MNNENDQGYGYLDANSSQQNLAWPVFAYAQPSDDVFAPQPPMGQRLGRPTDEFLVEQGMPLFALGPWSNNSSALRLFGQSTAAENDDNPPSTHVQTGRQSSHGYDQTPYHPMNEAGRANQPQPQSYAYVTGAELQEATPTPRSAYSPSERAPHSTERPTDATDAGTNAGDGSVEQKIRSFCNTKNYRYLKPRAEAHELSPHTSDMAEIQKKTPTRQFPGLFTSAAAANDALAVFQNLYRKPLRECTTPIEDESFPGSDEEMVAVVKSVFEAIVDWSYILEWKSALSREAKSQVARKLSAKGSGKEAKPDLDGLRPSPQELEKLLPSIDVQQKMILGQIPSDQTIEWVSWGIVHSKQLVKSLLTAGGGWKLRIVNCPRKEFRAKGNNRRVNAAKERQRRGMMRREQGVDEQGG
ncbi:Uncharacterized protein TPAR_03451 [Tolypocladium paradoxum]|uniref:Uncharacterized protein n=1 Tax=Tolypocladium paradoxum TaxID=94208 RepID=A0A2S4L1R8_9HYPO|nr:Uncharacterized protein TPAR_03451 [Tolypocladium paradoxum]